MGCPRTSTTSIQQGLFENIDMLRKDNYIYPKIGMVYYGHHNIYYDLARFDKNSGIFLSDQFDIEKGDFKSLLDYLRKCKKEDPSVNFILSSEAFINLNVKLLNRLAYHLRQIDDIRSIVVFRRQDKFLLSSWSLEVERLNMSEDFEKWALDTIQNNLLNLNYYQNVQKVLTCFEKEETHFMSFSQMIADKNPCKTFLKLCKLGEEELVGYKNVGPTNQSANPFVLKLLRHINADFGIHLTADGKEDLIKGIRDFSSRNNWKQYCRSKQNLITETSYRRIKEKYQNSNRVLINLLPNLKDELDYPRESRHIDDVKLTNIPAEEYDHLNSLLPKIIDIKKYYH